MLQLPLSKSRNSHGFTILEVLLIVALITILAIIVIVAINPGQQVAQTNNAQRQADVNTILNTIHHYTVANKGTIPESITTGQAEICKTGGNCTGLIDLSVLTASEAYITNIPADPTGSSINGTGYEILKTANNRVTVVAPDAELGATISQTK